MSLVDVWKDIKSVTVSSTRWKLRQKYEWQKWWWIYCIFLYSFCQYFLSQWPWQK